jgi:arylsulfatase A-like enzyme
MRNLFSRPPVAALALAWPFLSLPRLWLVATSDAAAVDAVRVLGVGLLRDGLWVAALCLPFQLHRVWRGERIPGRAGQVAIAAVPIATAAWLAALFADAEFVRYLGFHPTWTHVSLAGDWSGFRSSVGHSLAPLVLPMLALPLAYLLAAAWLPLDKLAGRMGTGFGIAASLALMGLGMTAGRFPTPESIPADAAESFALSLLGDGFAADELASDGEGGLAALLDTGPLPDPRIATPAWSFFDADYPLVKATDHHLCRLGLLDAAACRRDGDADGIPLARDCNDLEAGIHPGAHDVPRNGIDEDCSGLDADPPNVIFIHWEGIRSVNVGRIGYATPATPRFDRISRDGVLFSNAYANGTQTRWSLISVYCSTLPRLSDRWIFKHDPGLSLLCLPEILAARGYHNLYVHGGLIGFAGKGPRMRSWFETRYDRRQEPIRSMPRFNWGARDPEVLDFTLEMLRSRSDRRPFFLALATLAVHHPFGLPEPGFAQGSHGHRRNQLANVTRYSDDALADFLEELLADPRFENTVVLVASDHGINWFDPHPEGRQSVLWEDLVWVPMALLGESWNAAPGVVAEVRQLADIGPTVLDRLGIELPNPFVGHSLLRRFGERESRAFFATANGGRTAGVRMGRYKFTEHFETGRQSLFDLEVDREEQMDLADDADWAGRVDELRELVVDVYGTNERLIDENRVWSPRFELSQ